MPNYEDDFYTAANIIGYTGDLNDNPSVYFQKGNKFGRITQEHDEADNIGRNIVREYADYRIGNTGKGGTAQEYYGGAVQHESRNAFIARTAGNVDELAKAINTFKELKARHAKKIAEK